MARTAAKAKEGPNVNEELDRQLAELGLADSLQLADQYTDMQVRVQSTGFPGLDIVLHPALHGLVRGRDVEIFSRKESAGKTSLALQILKAWQDAGLKTAIVDIERTVTESYLNNLGIITRPELCPPGISAIRILRSRMDPKTEEQVLLTLEEVLNTVDTASKKVFDLIVIDSIDALVQKSEAEKTAEENNKQGGISKKLSEFMRKNVSKRATVIWINQTRQSMAYNPTGNVTYVTSGGRAVPFYSSIRLELAMVQKLQEGENDPWGFTVKITTIKNKLAAMWRNCQLTYVFGEGFSQVYDYFDIALKNKIIVKSGAWLSSDELGLKAQGVRKMYEKLKANENGSFDTLKKLVDGENVHELEDTNMSDIAPDLAPEEEENQ